MAEASASTVSAPFANLRAARVGISAVFFVNGVVLATWVARIPAIKARLNAGEGALGIALLGLAVGALAAMPLTGGLVARFGSRQVVRVAALALCFALPLPALAPSLPLLALALFLLGASNGMLDVAQNAQGALVEHHYGRPIMTSFHALFSLGGLLGAGLGALAAGQNVSPLLHFCLLAALGLLIALISGTRLLHGGNEGSTAPFFALPSRALLGLGAVAFCTLLGEGAVADWSAVYLESTLGTTAATAAIGYAAFSLTMAAGRFAGDWLAQQLAPARLVQLGGGLAALGLASALVIGTPLAALIGFGCVGAGLSCIFPQLLSAAARVSGTQAGPAIAAVATAGYTGFLAGPPLIGLLGQASTLRLSLGVVVLAFIFITVGARSAQPR